MFYREDKKGQILEEGINEAGAMSSWIAAGTSYSTHNQPMLPFYIFYSMFGFQRIGDLAWAAGDSRAHGFLIGGTAGRTTLNGEGLQHEDGHSHLLASTIPNCRTYDPTYAYELAVIIREGSRQMIEEQQDIFYYITVMNENYVQPAMPKGAEEGIIKGMYLLEEDKKEAAHHVQLLGSGTILREVEEAAKLLRNDFGIGADVWSVPSFNELRRDGLAVERWNRLHPGQKPKQSYVEECLGGRRGPVIASTDYMKLYAEQIRQWVPSRSTRCSAPTASAAATAARSCATSSKWIVTGWCWPRSKRWPIAAISSRKWWPRPSPSTVSIRRSATRWIANSLHTPLGSEGFRARRRRQRAVPAHNEPRDQSLVLRAAQRWWHVKGEECERTHSRTRHRQR